MYQVEFKLWDIDEWEELVSLESREKLATFLRGHCRFVSPHGWYRITPAVELSGSRLFTGPTGKTYFRVRDLRELD